jgi:CHRD domain-containing protein
MQMQIFRRIGFGLLALGLTLSTFAIFGCSSSDNETERNAALFGFNERPTPNTSQGSGTAVLTISSDQTQIGYVLTYNGLANVTQAHIHVGDANTAGPIILFLCTNIGGAPAGAAGGQACPQGSAVTVSGTLTAIDLVTGPLVSAAGVNSFNDAVTQLNNGNTYSNVHTQAFPAGEIRGQDL